MKPLIGILTSNKDFKGKIHSAIYYDYVNSIHKAGGAPILLPLINDQSVIEPVVSKLDGLLLPGGIDLHPKFFNQEIKPLNGRINEEQDLFDLAVIETARKHGLPIFAICRGHQVLNVAYGGTIHQDISYDPDWDGSINHEQDKTELAYHLPIHDIKIKENTILHSICEGNMLSTNSFHHQVIDKLGNGLECVARSSDGVIEAIESTVDTYVVGVQWHPEKMVDYYEKHLNLFKRFVEACK
ncbi:gamma-glutamyl-gamma-aminobutyrate hydrolase family protein [Haloplasma contractile]|uniref:Gamma-glutamyl-gamma-aminobutyrate hydrolase protein n=1 Tax=Haloplasma contractile SSD-17B TaxID=1033810 RepID=U2FJX6_9MOLU|nr:gamma-glutamyl-gamma-aminobutyrate hydrolase family protein [Haloplasma contractile]ERJ13120.1 gamma-glutamyl-gamma-aminobutyrate hydrolase protein [Haloplasma contractile SSD-17B]